VREENKLQVYYHDRLVGILAQTEKKMIAFAYDDEWLRDGFSISPFSLPLEKRVFVPAKYYFGGLFGVFADSLPDAWGNILLNQVLKNNDLVPGEINALERLAIVGDSGMGALSYRPVKELSIETMFLSLDELAKQCKDMLSTGNAENLDELYRLGGTSGGARPKVMVEMDGESWIIKFPAHVDGPEVGLMEYEYARCAKLCGIDMTQTRLLASESCPGYFGTERFDRKKMSDGLPAQRVHMLTAAALLELDFSQPSLDYHALMKLTKILTRDDKYDMEQMYRRMCFNVFAHNRDDHSKNFSYLYDETKKMWRLSPAYDITYSNTYYGEHTTTVDGNGRNPGHKELTAVGEAAGLKRNWCLKCAKEIEECVRAELNNFSATYLYNMSTVPARFQ